MQTASNAGKSPNQLSSPPKSAAGGTDLLKPQAKQQDSDSDGNVSDASSNVSRGSNPKIYKKIQEMDDKTLQVFYKLSLKLQKTHYTVNEMVKDKAFE